MKYLLLAAIGASIVGFYLYSDKNHIATTNSNIALADDQQTTERNYTATQNDDTGLKRKLSHGIHKPDY